MATNQRRKPRKAISAAAFIYTTDGRPIGECRTLDISASGAKILLSDEDKDVPPEFLLALSRDGKVRRRCQTRWREGEKIGVRFDLEQ
jgi:hypothetical protein